MAETMPVSAPWRWVLPLAASVIAWLPSSARADDACLDASEEARAMLSKKRLLDARAKLRVCAASTCDESIRTLCGDRLAEVTDRLPSIIFDAKDADGRDIADVKLTIDGAAQDAAVGTEITLDPGAHTFVFEAPGAAREERRLVLVEHDKGRREHITFGAHPDAAPRVDPSPAPLVATPSPASASAPASAETSSPLATAGWITLGAGAVGLGIGTAYGIDAITKNADAHCDAQNVCDDPRARHEARMAAGVSTAAFVTGGVLAAAGGVLIWLARHPSRPRSVASSFGRW